MSPFTGSDLGRACGGIANRLQAYNHEKSGDKNHHIQLIVRGRSAPYLWRTSINEWAYKHHNDFLNAFSDTLWNALYKSKELIDVLMPEDTTIEIKVIGWKERDGAAEDKFLKEVFYDVQEPYAGNGIRCRVFFDESPPCPSASILQPVVHEETQSTSPSPSWSELRLLYHLQKAIGKHKDPAINGFILDPAHARREIARFLTSDELQRIRSYLFRESQGLKDEPHRKEDYSALVYSSDFIPGTAAEASNAQTEPDEAHFESFPATVFQPSKRDKIRETFKRKK
ncbi:hypothetical protein JCM3765_002072 [Sporobolomyces pararoseus]